MGWGLNFFVGSPREFLGFDICPHSIIAVTINPAYPRVQIHIFRSYGLFSFFFLGGGGDGGNSLGVRRSELSMIIICQRLGFDS